MSIGARGLTQLVVADAVGIDRTTYSRIENGSRNIAPEELEAICSVIRCKPMALLREAGYTAFPEEIST